MCRRADPSGAVRVSRRIARAAAVLCLGGWIGGAAAATGSTYAPIESLTESQRVDEYVRLRDEHDKLLDARLFDALVPVDERALALIESLPSVRPERAVFNALMKLAEAYHGKGDYGKEELTLKRAMEDATRRASLADGVEVDIQHAKLAAARGDFNEAARGYQEVRELLIKVGGRRSVDAAEFGLDIAKVTKQAGAYGIAEKILRDALAVIEDQSGSENRTVAEALNELAEIQRLQGRDRESVPLLERALKILMKTKPPGGAVAHNSQIARTLTMLASVSYATGDYALAAQRQKRAVKVLEKITGEGNPVNAGQYHALAIYMQAVGELEQARDLYAQAGELQERRLSYQVTSGTESQRQHFLDEVARESRQVVSFHVRAAPHDPRAARAAVAAVLRRKGRLLEAVAESVASLRRRLGAGEASGFDQLMLARARLAGLAVGGYGKSNPDEYQKRLTALQEETQQLEAKLSLKSVEFREQAQTVTLERVQAAVPSDAVLAELFAYEPFDAKAAKPDVPIARRYVAYAVRRHGDPVWADLGEAAPIDALVASWRAALAEPQRHDVRHVARALDERVGKPLRALLGETRTVLLSPDGALTLIPFGALVDEENRYLVERYAFRYLTSGRDLLRLHAVPSSTPALVVADPDFNGAGTDKAVAVASADTRAAGRRSVDFASIEFSPLPGTAGEAKALAAVLPGAVVLTGAQATEAAIKQARSPSILHVATHGFFLDDQRAAGGDGRGVSIGEAASGGPAGPKIENPLLRSGLAFTGANRRDGSGEDGILTALEASSLDLQGTKLVVLSACETGVGRVENGEGVYGLRRALVLAGAETQVMSLWKVDDEATKDLMVGYYKRLLAGEGRSDALRHVQLSMLKSPATAHPFYWASFIASGDWRPLAEVPAGVPVPGR